MVKKIENKALPTTGGKRKTDVDDEDDDNKKARLGEGGDGNVLEISGMFSAQSTQNMSPSAQPGEDGEDEDGEITRIARKHLEQTTSEVEDDNDGEITEIAKKHASNETYKALFEQSDMDQSTDIGFNNEKDDTVIDLVATEEVEDFLRRNLRKLLLS